MIYFGIGNLDSKLSRGDIEKVRGSRNPPEFEDGFEDDVISDDAFSDLFDDIELPSRNDSGFNDDIDPMFTQFSDFNTNSSSSIGIGGSNLPNIGQQTSNQQAKKDDTFDKIIDCISKIGVAGGKSFIDLIKSFKIRTADDWGYISSNLIKIGIIVSLASIPIVIIGTAGKINILSLSRIPLSLILTGLTTCALGLIGLGISAIYLERYSKEINTKIDDIEDVFQDNSVDLDEFEEDVCEFEDDIFEFEDEYETEEDDTDYFSNDTYSTDNEPEDKPIINEVINYEEKEDNISENVPMLTREFLYNTFKGFFPTNTAGFADIESIDIESDKFYSLETLCMKALASAARLEFEEATSKSELISADETYFTYILRLKRIKGLNKLEDIEREIVAYFRESSDDTSVSCTADLEGDVYKLVINKGVSALVTIGDVLTQPKVEAFIKDNKNALPIVAGITENGQPVLTDAKFYDTMLIAGKPRSGKSWYVLSLIWMMMVFNSPEDLQFLFIDPKESNLFKTLALMPHVCGIHNDTNILSIFKDLIENEGPRRKKLLSDNRCENVWDLRKKGIKIPILYIVIDEVMTVISNLGSSDKEFMSLVKVVVTQLPSLGIRLIMVPHRSQGVVDKTVRTNIGFTAAVRADTEVVQETLDIKKWTTPLLNPGDTALKMQGFGKEMFIHSLAVTTTDTDNTDHIMSIARSFYKMGVEIPDMSSIGCGYNRDMEHIRDELGEIGVNRVQFNINDIGGINLEKDINDYNID